MAGAKSELRSCGLTAHFLLNALLLDVGIFGGYVLLGRLSSRRVSLFERRIVSLLASATEIVCALGARERLVGRSHECDNPGWVRLLPACSEPGFDVTVSAGEIDAEVRRRLQTREPLYRLHSELIASLRPDLLITQKAFKNSAEALRVFEFMWHGASFCD